MNEHLSCVKRMPFEGNFFEYRIKRIEKQFARVAKEHELSDVEVATRQGK